MDDDAFYKITTRYYLILDGDRRGGGGFDNYRRRSPEPAKKVREILVKFCLVIQV